MRQEERDQLIDAALDGDISEADFLRLEAELHVSSPARQAYYDRLKLATLLEVEAEEAPAYRAAPSPPNRRRWATGSWGAAAAAAIIVCAVLLGRDAVRQPAPVPERAEAVASGYAVLAREADAVWKEGTRLDQGDLVPGGQLELLSGLAQLELFSGVTVVVEGAATFEVRSPMEMDVSRGRVRATVPPAAQGFRVRTAEGEVVDLGTEFALDVSLERTEVHVLDGEVEWHPDARPVVGLDEGDAIAWGQDGDPLPAASADGRFVGSEQLAAIVSRSRGARAVAWKAASDTIASDPRLIAFYPIGIPPEAAGIRTVANIAATTRDALLSGAIVATEPVSDRWGAAAGALDFSPAGSRVRVHIPGEFPAMTFVCWARIDGVDRLFNSLFLTDNYQKGEPHWQITEKGELFLSVRAKARKRDAHHMYISPPFWNPGMSGQWVQLATVFDPVAEKVTHYLDGEVLSEEAVPEDMRVETLRIGSASIGNWSEPTRNEPAFAVRNLNGAIDDLLLFSTALTATEIRTLYEQSSP